MVDEAVEHDTAVVTVRRTVLDRTKENQERIEIRPFVTAVAKIGCTKRVTIKVDDYQYAQISVNLTVPCYVEEAREVYGEVSALVDDLIEQEVQEVQEMVENGEA